MIKIWKHGKENMANTWTNSNTYARKENWLIVSLEKLPKIYFAAKKGDSAKCGQNPPTSL
jgi:hypothetical protein